MRIFVLSLFIIPLFLPSCGGNGVEEETSAIDSTYCECNDLTFDQQYNHFWLFERREGFTGKCEEFDAAGVLLYEKNFLDGKMEGEYVQYHSNGQAWKIRNYMQNFQDGDSFTYSMSGKLIAHARYKRGKLKEMVFEDRSIKLTD
jgi:hypothetical protein